MMFLIAVPWIFTFEKLRGVLWGCEMYTQNCAASYEKLLYKRKEFEIEEIQVSHFTGDHQDHEQGCPMMTVVNCGMLCMALLIPITGLYEEDLPGDLLIMQPPP